LFPVRCAERPHWIQEFLITIDYDALLIGAVMQHHAVTRETGS
jgi:hypothetical protein